MSRETWSYVCKECEKLIYTKSSRRPGNSICRPCLAYKNLILINKLGKQGGHKLRPFEHCYKSLIRNAKSVNREVYITYEQYLEFTKVVECHYCNASIQWSAYSLRDEFGQGIYSKYYLDRKNNSEEYTVQNSVVCCPSCNKLKGANFSYEEFLAIIPIISKMRTNSSTKGS